MVGSKLFSRIRKYVLCFYRVVEIHVQVEVRENEKCYGNTSCRVVFPYSFFEFSQIFTSVSITQYIVNNYSPKWRWLAVDIY